MRIAVLQPPAAHEPMPRWLRYLDADIEVSRGVIELDAKIEKSGAPQVLFVVSGAADPVLVDALQQRRRYLNWPATHIVAVLSEAECAQDLPASFPDLYDDVVTGSLTRGQLDVKLGLFERTQQRIKRLERAQGRLRFAATHDDLTGIWSKGAIMSHLYRELSRAQRSGNALSVAICDIDRFKIVNDTHGHLVGDEVLREVVHRVESVLRPYDLLGRYGGEEFLLILPACGLEDAMHIAERARCALSEESVQTTSGSVEVNVSIGVASVGQLLPARLSRRGPEVLVDVADQALYAAKRQGRNRCVAWAPGTDATAHHELA